MTPSSVQEQMDSFIRDLERELSEREAQRWRDRIRKRKKKRKEFPLDISHSK